MTATAVNEFNQTDSMIERERGSRVLALGVSVGAILFLGFFLGTALALWLKLPLVLGYSIGLGAGMLGAFWVISRSIIMNDAVTAFVTVDPLTSFLNLGNALVTYGPGFHLCYWWEKRSGANVVSLAEAAESGKATVQTSSGTIHTKYSVRLRPDIRHLGEFLGGVASVAADLNGIIASNINQFFTKEGMDVEKAIGSLSKLNAELAEMFRENKSEKVTDFEKRFGVIIGDVTVEEILPSDEVQKTMSALTESAKIDQIVANSFGYTTIKGLNAAIAKGKIDQSEASRRRTLTMALSGNLQGMDLKDHTIKFKVEGLEKIDPVVAQAIAGSAHAAAEVFKARSSSGKTSSTKKGGSK